MQLPVSYVPTYIPKKPTPLEDKVSKEHFEGDFVPDREESDFKLYEPTPGNFFIVELLLSRLVAVF